jgi:hypothetical protein
MRRWLSVGSVLVLLSVGLAGSATASKVPGPPQVPAVQATVKDQCTGGPVPGFAASLVDAPGNAPLLPSKTTTAGFVFQTGPAIPNFVLHVTAPGYVSLGGAPDVGVTLTNFPGPVPLSADQQSGPTELPGGVEAFTGLRVAVLLEPSTGCAVALRKAAVPAVSGKVFEHFVLLGHSNVAWSPLTDFTVDAVPDPATPGVMNPGPIQISHGTFVIKTLECGAYDIDVSAPQHVVYAGTLLHEIGHDLSNCHNPPASGDVAVGTVMVIVLPVNGFNRPPVIDWTTASTYATHAGGTVQLTAAAHDPDPADNPVLAYQWSSTDGTCAFTISTSPATDVSCGVGTALITLTVTDPHAATATSSFALLTIPSIPSIP